MIPLSASYSISDGFVEVSEYNFLGHYVTSQDNKYILSWSSFNPDAPSSELKYREFGKFLIIEDYNIILSGESKHPYSGAISNNRTFFLNTISEYLPPSLIIFSPYGDILLEKENYRGEAISQNGLFVLGVPLEEDVIRGYEILDINKNTIISRFLPIVRKYKECRIDDKNLLVIFSYQGGIEHKYGFDGSFLDNDRWEKDRLMLLSGYDLIPIGEKELANINSNEIKSFNKVILLFQCALDKGVSEYYQAIIHRRLGEIYHKCNLKEESLIHLKKALELNPKIGVKKLYEKLLAS